MSTKTQAATMDYESQGLLHEMFQRQAQDNPDDVAVVSVAEKRQVTFYELDQWSNMLAAALQQRGAAADRCVALCLDKNIDFVISYIAILKAGAAYLPLDGSYPSHMLESVLEDALPVVIITSPEFEGKLKNVIGEKVKTLVLNEGWTNDMPKQMSPKFVPPEVHLDNLAYVVYSSGTTGKPKGIQCPHRGAVFSYHSRHTLFPYGENEKEACNIFFVWEMMRPLLKGVPMYPFPNSVVYDPPLLCHHVQANALTRMLFTPSLLETLLNSPDLDLSTAFKSMRQIWFCGEVVTTSLLKRCIAALPWVHFINLYSVSECHDVACVDLTEYYEKNKETLLARKFCPVGKVLQGVHIVILGDEGKPLPVGCSGEIYVGGPTLARGYVNRPEQQAKRFVPRPQGVPESYGERLYRTGDYGYMLSDGSLEIHGRVDTMVKIRGYSIEVQAVEVALLSLPMVSAALVIVCGEEGEDKFLVSYIVKEGPTSKKEVRGELKRRLPFYMIPAYFVFLDSIPVVAATGKLDKKALPPFDWHQTEEVGAEGRPTTAMEKHVAQIWAEVLRVQEVDIHESFFDMGGHSLLATELQRRVKDTFGVNMNVSELFTYPTVSLLSHYIEAAENNSKSEAADVAPERTELDLSVEVNKHDQIVLDLDIQLRAFWRTSLHRHHFRKGRALLTGATGFLGAFLLKEMLLNSKLLVYCLVRELPNTDLLDRVKATLRQYDILPKDSSRASEEQTTLENLFNKRVIAMKGNVALMKLGMSDDDYTYLTTDTDVIVHAAANVNLAYPYSALHGPNVLGTQNVILFASTGKVKPIHYVSTNGVFPHGLKGCSEEDDLTEVWGHLTDGYSQSKWVAEQLVTRAGQRGLPVTIYRLGNLGGDRNNAAWNPQDFTLLLLAACARYGTAPDVDWEVEMTPVDFAANVIVNLIQHPDAAIGKTLHVVNDKPLPARWIFKWMNANGYYLSMLPFDKWRKKILNHILEAQKSGDPGSTRELASILQTYIMNEQSLTKLSSFKNDRFKGILSELRLEYPYTDARLLQTYFRKLSAKNVMPRQRRNTASKPLSDRVVIVTGASSGIGAAVSIALASAGARVAMAARREEKLRELEKRISDEGGVAVSVKTDILDRQQVQDMVQQTEMALGPVDILINCAGVMYYTLMKNIHQDEWDRTIDINCKGVTNCIAAVLDGMVKRESGHIVNISSDAGRKGFPGLAVYSGSKFFVEGMSQAMRSELADTGVKVTCIQPGDVKTPLFGLSTDAEAVEKYDMSENHKCLEPYDIARAILYAVSAPDYVAVNEILVEPRDAPM